MTKNLVRVVEALAQSGSFAEKVASKSDYFEGGNLIYIILIGAIRVISLQNPGYPAGVLFSE